MDADKQDRTENGTLPALPGGAREKRVVALSSVLAAIFLTSIKLVVGLLTQSLADYGVTAQQLSAVTLTVEQPTDWSWLL